MEQRQDPKLKPQYCQKRLTERERERERERELKFTLAIIMKGKKTKMC
jgi:hypothetical protein